MSFEWIVPPEAVWPEGMARYKQLTLDTLYDLMVREAPNVEQFMRAYAPWHDDCMPGREYLKARPFRDDARLEIGIRAFYDHALYAAHCGEQEYPFGIAHETYTWRRAGVISIILPRRPNTVLGDEAPRIWDQVKALYGALDVPYDVIPF